VKEKQFGSATFVLNKEAVRTISRSPSNFILFKLPITCIIGKQMKNLNVDLFVHVDVLRSSCHANIFSNKESVWNEYHMKFLD